MYINTKIFIYHIASRYSVQCQISAKHQFTCPAVISVITISVILLIINCKVPYIIVSCTCTGIWSRMLYNGCMIWGYHVYKDVWLSYIWEMLYCRCDERSTEGPFWWFSISAAKQNWNIYSFEVLVKRQVNQITRHRNVTRAAMTELKWRYMCDCGMELRKTCRPVTSHRIHTKIKTLQTKPAIQYLIKLMIVYAHFICMLPCLSQASQCFCPRALGD